MLCMSTIDPRVARIQSHDVLFAGAVAGWLTAFLAVLHVLVWAIAAVAGGATLDVLRKLIIDGGDGEGSFQLLVGWPLLVLVLLGFMLGAAVHSAAERVTSEGAASALRFSTASLGLTFGFLAFASRWTAPQAVGSRQTYWASGSRPWGLLEWVAYWMPVWLPGLTGLIAVVTTGMTAGLIARRIRSQQRMVEVLTNGMHTSGHVSHVRWSDEDGKGRCHVRFTVTYVDRTGQRRWVEKVVQMAKAEIPAEGGPAEVWYDKERLNDTSRIAVDVAPHGTAGARPEPARAPDQSIAAKAAWTAGG